MPTAPAKIAIVLHAPPAVGKTRIWEAIRRRQGNACRVSLDDGWSSGEIRYKGGPDRYADLANTQSPVLVVELGWGEPAGLASFGATRAAGEWVGVLRAAGRSIFPFLLWSDYSTAVERLRHRHSDWRLKFWDVSQGVGVRAMYENRDPLFTFPPIPDFTEVRIDTTGREYDAIADEIMRTAGLLGS